jgi:hypothetical protein
VAAANALAAEQKRSRRLLEEQVADHLRRRWSLEEELAVASTQAAVPITERVVGLGDADFRTLEDAMRVESARRQRLAMEREMRRE